ncbi:alpha/beta hydrolase [Aquabacter spiritensis]|uniref:Acetyl xylan esterase AXE1 n=1 Tax=Aquabacter spiritensis TaxID=933073 RepID=A0A4R3M3Q7_9HYPH|nr:acetylxylan esterase [Aquabacter spiritensis]TCT07840.1 acetyl xylan esterase AXE1 [Aquabacter spiritensis]
MRQQAPRANQNWIFDNFLKMSTNEDVLHPGILGLRLERGFKHQDMERVFHAAQGRRALPKEWSKIAQEQEDKGTRALEKGRRVTAGQYFHRAMLYWGRAQHLIPVDGSPKKIEYYNGLARCRDKMIELLDGAVTKQSFEFAPGKSTYTLYQAAPGEGRKPTVLYIPGMDAAKEDYPSPYNNEFTRRGMNLCAMDGPGQGECNMNKVWLTPDNYAQAVKRVIDWLVTRDDVDPTRIGVFGASMGTRWGVEAAAIDPRISALVGQMPCVGPLDIIFEQAQPNFKRIYMYMCNMKDEAAFDAMVSGLDLRTHAAKMTCSYLLAGGEMDELCPPEDMRDFLKAVTAPKEFWLYEGVFHPMGEVAGEINPAIADWLLETLNNPLPAGYDRTVIIE